MLALKDLNAGYGKLAVLHDLSLTFGKYPFTAILGPNGSGKSTLLKSIFGLTTIHGGSILLDGQELVGCPTETISRYGIAYVPQRENVFTALTVSENLLLALRKLDGGQRKVRLDEAYQLFPSLQKRRQQRAGQLSGGERQMVALAIGWLSHPRVMLWDEPSAGLSPLLTTEVFKTLKTLASQDVAIIVVEQNARAVLRWCDFVFVLRDGQLAFQGSADECRADEELLKQYLGVGVSRNPSGE